MKRQPFLKRPLYVWELVLVLLLMLYLLAQMAGCGHSVTATPPPPPTLGINGVQWPNDGNQGEPVCAGTTVVPCKAGFYLTIGSQAPIELPITARSYKTGALLSGTVVLLQVYGLNPNGATSVSKPSTYTAPTPASASRSTYTAP